MPNHPKTVTIDSWKGLNNVLAPERTEQGYLKTAENIDIDKSGGIRKRKGYTLAISGEVHSLWSEGNDCIAVIDGNLVRISSDYSTTNLVSNIGDERLSYVKEDGAIYYTSVSHTGIIEGNTVVPFGIEAPNPHPSLSATIGNLTAGEYQVTLTYVTVDGRESGARLAQQLTFSSGNKGISVTGIPTSADSRVNRVRVYCSTPNGEVLYLIAELANGTSSYTITDVSQGVTPLKSFNVYQAPKGQIIRYAHGRMWIAQDNILWFSEPFSPEWWKPHSNFQVYEERITAVMPTEGGMWVAADQLYYISGKDPAGVSRKAVEPVRAVEGTDVKIVGAYIFIENTPIGYKWLVTTDKGIYVCFNDGLALNMTEKNVAFPQAADGTAMFVQEEGINRYVSQLRKEQDTNNAAVGDLVTAEIVRNGVVIP